MFEFQSGQVWQYQTATLTVKLMSKVPYEDLT